ncbi:hypothetical protein [Noviherbaspirillum saxi]|uniref:hypothetical protein n=1 Tax=Noviherbaspirillum saxi TaxID=2320863 RepID=UPI0018F5C71D|nr:hypothetical protein [Noviherbaspirillum saxi]
MNRIHVCIAAAFSFTAAAVIADAPLPQDLPATDTQQAPSGTKPPVTRRAVPATIVRMPEPPAPAPVPAPPVIATPQPVGPPAPAPVTGCDAGGCWSGGTRYLNSGGNYVSPEGRTCRSVGALLQC